MITKFNWFWWNWRKSYYFLLHSHSPVVIIRQNYIVKHADPYRYHANKRHIKHITAQTAKKNWRWYVDGNVLRDNVETNLYILSFAVSYLKKSSELVNKRARKLSLWYNRENCICIYATKSQLTWGTNDTQIESPFRSVRLFPTSIINIIKKQESKYNALCLEIVYLFVIFKCLSGCKSTCFVCNCWQISFWIEFKWSNFHAL